MTDMQEGREVHGMNLVSVKPENQQQVVDTLREIGPLKEIPGLLSLQVLRSADGDKLLTYMRWESMDAFQQAEQHPQVMAVITKVTQFIEDRGTAAFYQVIYTHE